VGLAGEFNAAVPSATMTALAMIGWTACLMTVTMPFASDGLQQRLPSRSVRG
jgi:hypothetical protein